MYLLQSGWILHSVIGGNGCHLFQNVNSIQKMPSEKDETDSFNFQMAFLFAEGKTMIESTNRRANK